MNKRIFGLCLIIMMVIPIYSWRGDPKVSKEIRKELTFKNPTLTRKVEVDNLFGKIQLEGYNGKTVKAVIKKQIFAKDDDDVQLAKKEITLDISQENNIISFYVDGPFRCRNGMGCRKYRVQYDFVLQVPKKTEVCLKTVNSGYITVDNIDGDFNIKNVNGKIIMNNINGSGDAKTVNGKVQVKFSNNPSENCGFKSINGNLELTFPKEPSADFYLKTFNGRMYSDYDFSYLPVSPAKGFRKGSKFVYKSNRFQGVRLGSGGPRITVDAFNGDILIAQKND